MIRDRKKVLINKCLYFVLSLKREKMYSIEKSLTKDRKYDYS